MKPALIFLFLALFATEALAISRVQAASRTCAQIQALLQREGAALLTRQSSGGGPQLTLYDRYVGNAAACGPDLKIARTSVVTSDSRACPVNRCTGRTKSR
jgi:hypothetical protein